MENKLFFLFVLLTSCSLFGNSDKPKDTSCDWPPGNRNYSWRIDTVGYWSSTMGGLYVFNDSTAFITGYIKTKNAGLLPGLTWNGSNWLTDIYNPVPEFPIGHYGNDATGDDTLMVSVGYWGLNLDQAAIGEFNLKTKTWKNYKFEEQGELNSVWTDGKGFYVAVGANGIIYTKDSPTSDWVFSRMEDRYNLKRVSGISKTEWYIIGYKYLDPRKPSVDKVYRMLNGSITILYDSTDLESSILSLDVEWITDISAIRCVQTDSLYLFVSGSDSYKLTSFEHELSFQSLNLTKLSSGVIEIKLTNGFVFAFTPFDIWLPTLRYGIYHYNGMDIKKIETIPNLNYGDVYQLGQMVNVKKSDSGKLWILMETWSQNYILIQGTPL